MKRFLEKLLVATLTVALLLPMSAPAMAYTLQELQQMQADAIGKIATSYVYINNQSEFDKFVNDSKTNNYSGKNVCLTSDVTLAGFIGPAFGSKSGYFAGTFEGNGHTIKVSGTNYDRHGVFNGTNGATVNNLTVSGDAIDINWGNTAGGIIGEAYNTTVTNCIVKCKVHAGSHNAGGIIGYAENSTVQNCSVNANVDVIYESGGIIGKASDTVIRGCTFEGEVFGLGDYSGGMVAYGKNMTIIDCVNKGKAGARTSGSSSTFAGGMIGCYDGDLNIKNCVNEGAVEGDRSVGGIVGAPVNAHTDNTRVIEYVVNRGTVTMTPIKDHGAIGGIAGILCNVTLNNAQNYGAVSADSTNCGANAGGLVGSLEKSAMTYSMNYGNVTGSATNNDVISKTGGLIGWIRGDQKDNAKAAEYCGNQGDVKGFGDNVGAFAGLSDKVTVRCCISCGTITGNKNASRYATDSAIVSQNNYSKAMNTVNAKMTSGRYPLWGPDDNGKPTILFDGSGTEEDPYRIDSLNELKHLSTNVSKNGVQYKNSFFRLDADIVDDGTLTPIGGDKGTYAFCGNFDGNGHTVYLNMVRDSGYVAGLFGWVYGSTIKNLRTAGYVVGVKDGSVSATKSIDGLKAAAGICAKASKTQFINCQNDANVQGTIAGGIVGAIEMSSLCEQMDNTVRVSKVSVNNCVNRGQILGISAAGGIAGRAACSGYSMEFVRDVNTGDVTPLYVGQVPASDPPTGQIIGYVSDSNTLIVNNCYSKAGVAEDVLCGNYSGETSCGIFDGSEYSSITDKVNNADLNGTFKGNYKPMSVTEKNIGFSMFGHTHNHPETVYYEVASGIGFNGHSTYYGCNTCGKFYTDEEMNSETNPILLMFSTTIDENDEDTPVTTFDNNVFFSSDEVAAFIKNNPNNAYSYIDLGFDIETAAPVKYDSDLTVNLNGHTWLYSGAENSAVLSDHSSSGQARTLTINGSSDDKRGTIEIYEYNTCRLLDTIRWTTEITISNTNIKNAGTTECGGMIRTEDSLEVPPTINLENVTVSGAHADKSGGAIYITCSDLTAAYKSRSINLKNTIFENCSALEKGGAICIENAVISVNGDKNSKFTKCHAKKGGGAIYIDMADDLDSYCNNGDRYGIYDLRFIGNYTGETGNFSSAKNNDKIGHGGAVYCGGFRYFISGCVFQSNLAAGDGGGVLARDASIIDCSFVDNMAVGFGYDIYFGTGTLSNITVQNTKEAFEDDLIYSTEGEEERPVKIYIRDGNAIVENVSFADSVVGSAVAEGRVVFVVVGAAIAAAVIAVLFIARKKKKTKKA